MIKNWYQAAMFCLREFGSYVDLEEGFFHCPECDEPIYDEDWEKHNWNKCPVCEIRWEEIE